MDGEPYGRVAAALTAFLAADPAGQQVLAPGLVAAVGPDRLAKVLAETRDRVGPFTAVEDSPAGLMIRGTRGRVPVYATTDPEGRLTGLYISGRRHSAAAAFPRGTLPPALALAVWPLVLAAAAATLWTAGSAAAWLEWAAVVGLLLVLALGFRAPSPTLYPRPVRRAVAVVVLACALSALRLPGRPAGRFDAWTYAPWAVVALLAALVAHSRLRSVPDTVSGPLRLPVDPGTWYVGQGGGRWLNHHHAVPEQRAALDLVKLRADGARAPGLGPRRDPAAYAAYGTPLFAPCDGTVVEAVDGHPDQAPGRPRFAPPAGNSVTIDTGRERVLLAHLRPGSVRVRPGDRVRAGDPLGEVGNSGNTTEPHLHLQADRDGRGLRLRFAGVRGGLWRGRRLVVPEAAPGAVSEAVPRTGPPAPR